MDAGVEIDFAVQKKESSTPNGIEDVSVAGRTPSWPCVIVGYAGNSVNWNSVDEFSDLQGLYKIVGTELRICRKPVDCRSK